MLHSNYFFVPEAIHHMVVDHPDCLHERIADRRTDKPEPPPLQLPAHRDGRRCLRGDIADGRRLADGRPKTLLELDDRITAPLSGFRDAGHYYDESSAIHVIESNQVKTLVVAAADDPVIPIDCYTSDRAC